jgi:hypothetical protein
MINNNFFKLYIIIPFFTLVAFSGSLNASTENNISTSTTIDMGADSIQGVLDEYSYINYSKGKLQTITPQTTSFNKIELINPLGITSSCGTVDINFDETLAILLMAFTQSLELMPPFLLKNTFGFPDISNPKALFEFIYDKSTTIICAGESVVESIAEWGIKATVDLVVKKKEGIADEDKTDQESHMMNKNCAIAAKFDKSEKKTKSSDNKSAVSQSEATGTTDTIENISAATKDCKIRYDGYKSFINAKIADFKLLEAKRKKSLDSSCDVLQNEKLKDAAKPVDERMGYTKVLKLNPIYLSQLQPQKITATFSCIDSNNVFQKDGTLDSDIIIDKQCKKDSLKVNVPLTLYKPTLDSSMHSTIYKLGYDYQTLLSSCISPISMLQALGDNDPEGLDVYFEACKVVNSKLSPFPLELSDPSKPSLDFTQIIVNKKAICDLTWFNIDNDQFIVDTIGYSTMALDSARVKMTNGYQPMTSPSIADLRTATKTVILEDFCEKKLIADIKLLDQEYFSAQEVNNMLAARDAKGVYLKVPAWRNNEVYVPPFLELPSILPAASASTTTSNKVYKICEKSQKQKEYFVATTDDSSTPLAVNIIKIKAKNLTELISELGFLSSESAPIESTRFTKYDTEMLCDNKPGQTTCDLKKLSCGINWTKATLREDTLFDNPKSTNKDEAGNDSKIGDFAAYIKRKFEIDKKSASSQKDFEINEVLQGRRTEIDALVKKWYGTMDSNNLFNDLIQIEYQNRLNNLRF